MKKLAVRKLRLIFSNIKNFHIKINSNNSQLVTTVLSYYRFHAKIYRYRYTVMYIALDLL